VADDAPPGMRLHPPSRFAVNTNDERRSMQTNATPAASWRYDWALSPLERRLRGGHRPDAGATRRTRLWLFSRRAV